jgi:gamma-glutamyltranspeptidase / glutathione hydrolase
MHHDKLRHGSLRAIVTLLCAVSLMAPPAAAQRTAKPPLHGQDWMAITGKPLAATAGALMFIKGGNAVDAAAAMLAATATMWDVLSWGGETQALIYNPSTREVIGLNALGVAPTGATPEFFRERGMRHPPEFGPLAAVTPGTPGGLFLMLAEFGRLSLAEVLEPAIRMADGYPIEAQTADSIERNKERLRQWKYSREVMLPHAGAEREAPHAGEIFRQPDLAATLRKLVEAEQAALADGSDRKAAIRVAHERFYRGDIAEELVRGVQEEGGLITLDDLAAWQPRFEDPVSTRYKDIDVYKLTVWTQGPAMLQALNILENFELAPLSYNSARYIHLLYQTMSLAFADRDFYYGDPRFPPESPVQGLLSKDYARARAASIGWERNDPDIKPGDPYPFQRSRNPFTQYLERWSTTGAGLEDDQAPSPAPAHDRPPTSGGPADAHTLAATADETFHAGTTSVVAADREGWMVSITPSGGWVPAVIAGRTGIGLSQRMQSFVVEPADNPYNVVAPGKQPRVTLTPTLALKDGRPFLAFAVQGGDSQDQDLLQYFLNIVEFGMTPQQAAEAANIHSFQMRASFGAHESRPGRLLLNERVPPWVRSELERMGYTLVYAERTAGPINAIWFDDRHGTFWGGSSHHGEDYGIAW